MEQPNTTTYVYEIVEEVGLFHQIMVLFAISQLSILLATTLVGIFMAHYKGEQIDKYSNITCEPRYEDKYPIQESTPDKTRTKTNENSYVIEVTPDGGVILKYDYSQEGFVYWSDKSVNFNYLEVVARKYVKMFDCSDVYIKASDDTDETKDDKVESEDEDEDSVFFVSKSKSKKYKKKRKSTSNIVRNKFVKIGLFKEFKFIQSCIDKTSKKNMTFDQYKELSLM